jgi:hypothetical protein
MVARASRNRRQRYIVQPKGALDQRIVWDSHLLYLPTTSTTKLSGRIVGRGRG